MAAMIFRTTFN